MNNTQAQQTWHRRRLRAEKRFRRYGIFALSLAVVMLAVLLGSIVWRGVPAFMRTEVKLAITFDPQLLGITQDNPADGLSISAYNKLVQTALTAAFPEASNPASQRELFSLISNGAGVKLKQLLASRPSLLGNTVGVWLPASSNADLYMKSLPLDDTQGGYSRISEQQAAWLSHLQEQHMLQRHFNRAFLVQGDSRLPEQAGFFGAMVGSALTLAICLLVVFPLGVMTAVYLEEFAPKSRWVDIIEVNINNLAAVPSIVFGLLGLAVYINVMGFPRSSSLVGGCTLAMMILPVIIIATRASLKAVPGSIRDAALALGASPLQVVWHHTLRLAMPGIMTGTILGMARAIGETAPLLMIGMVAFVADTPTGFTSPATVMPVQIYLWAGSSELGFAEKTAAGILVLLVLLLLMNALAIFLRKRFEVRW